MPRESGNKPRRSPGGGPHGERGSQNDRGPHGDRGSRGAGGPRGSAGGPGGRKFGKRKFCRFSADHVEYIDYKDYRLLREMLSERGKIKPRGQTGTSAKFQRMLTTAVKRARYMALVSPTKL